MKAKTIYLIRHGQHKHDDANGALGGSLTSLGQEQARYLAKRISRLPIAELHASSMTRALETAQFIAQRFPELEIKSSRILWEVVPSVPKFFVEQYPGAQQEEFIRGQRDSERAFERYFQIDQGNGSNGVHTGDQVIVCHGNIIRYFVCRVLQVSNYAWANMRIFNCSVTAIAVDEDGSLSLISYNDVGHLPEHLKTG